jgi:hypothetical protein
MSPETTTPTSKVSKIISVKVTTAIRKVFLNFPMKAWQ